MFFPRIAGFIRRQLLRSRWWRWHVFTPEVSRETMAPLLDAYGTYAAGGPYMERRSGGGFRRVSRKTLAARRALGASRRVVYLCDGRTLAGGLADRFKGILSLYALCEEAGYDFCICYTSPFVLEDWLSPADYDWRIAPADLSRDAAMVVLENTDDADYQTVRQAAWLRRRLAEGPAEMHVITNSNHAYTLDYGALFARLFRPAPLLADALRRETAAMQGRYVSVSARFLSLLGDFRETGANGALPPAEAQALLDRCLAGVERIAAAHPDHRILVGSDSRRFVEAAAKRVPQVYAVEGAIAHTDLMAAHNADAAHLKLFLDFLLISRASHIYLLHAPRLRLSGFPYAASRIGGAEMTVVKV